MIDLRKDGVSIVNNQFCKIRRKIDLRKELDASDIFNHGVQIRNPIDHFTHVHSYEYYQPGVGRIDKPKLFTYDLVSDPGFDIRIEDKF